MLTFLISLISCLPVLSYDLGSLIFVSQNTPAHLVSDFASLSSSSLPVLTYSPSLLESLPSPLPNLLFDYTFSLQDALALQEFSKANSVLYFSPQSVSNPNSKWTFFLHPFPQSEAKALELYLAHLKWSDYSLLSSESLRSKSLFSFLSLSYPEILSNSANQEVFDRYIGRVTKPKGNWKIVFLGEELGASKLMLSLHKNKIYRERCGLILSSKGWKGSLEVGAIGIVEESLENSNSEGEYEFKSILRAISIVQDIIENSRGSWISNEVIRRTLEERSNSHVVCETYNIANFKEEIRVVGKISGDKIEIFEDTIFPGNLTYFNNSPPKIIISANTGPIEYDGTFSFSVLIANMALQPMVHITNEDPSILPNFQLELYETDCGFDMFEYEYTSKCMKRHFDNLGLAYLTGANGTTIASYVDLFREKNIKLPQVSINYNEESLDDKTLFPEVLSTIPRVIYVYVILPYILRGFRWDHIIFLVNPQIERAYFSAFVDNARILEINILNTEDFMYVPFQKTETYYKEVEHILQFIYDSRCKIIVLMAEPNSHLYFMEALYDFGFRRGDLVLIFQTPLSYQIYSAEDFNVDAQKIVEIGDGSLALHVGEYMGEYGEQLQKQIAPLIYPYQTPYTCYRIDSLMLVVRAIDLMMTAGSDYEDFDQIMHFMRGIRFTGCTGKVSIDSSGNGLSDIVYTIYNFYVSEGEWKEEIAGSYTFGVTVPLKISKTIVWPDGTTQIPKDMTEISECGFPDSYVRSNQASQDLSIAITVALFCVVLILTVWVWRRFFSFQVEFLDEQKEMMFEDGVLVYLPLIEAVQFIGLGPGFGKTNFVLSFLCALSLLDFDEAGVFEIGGFWTAIKIVLGVCGLWCVSLLSVIPRIESVLPKFVKDFSDSLGYRLIQVFSQVLFVALNATLLEIYKCNNGIGPDLTDSFLESDCETFCWKDSHLFYLVAISVVLLCYNVCGILCRPISNGVMDYANVKIQPFYGVLKGIFQLVLVTINLHLKEEYVKAYSIVYSIGFVVWTLVLFRIETYNYERLNWWVRVITAGVCAHEILVLGYTLLDFPEVVVVIIQVLILTACIGVGIYFQIKQYPSMLYRKKGRNFDKLLKFAFTRRVKAAELTLHELDYVNRRE